MAAEEEYLFAFEDEARAQRFIERLTLNLKHLAIFREGTHVKVIDGAEKSQRMEIYRLAKESGAFEGIKLVPRKQFKTEPER